LHRTQLQHFRLKQTEEMSSTSTAAEGAAGAKAEKREQNKREYTAYFQHKAAQLAPHIKKTTTTPSGQVLDWILPEAQGPIATPPPIPKSVTASAVDSGAPAAQKVLIDRPTASAVPELELPGAEKGPEGTVPILRQKLELLSFSHSLTERLSKKGPPTTSEAVAAAPAAPAPHWYASTAQVVPNLGGQGYFSAFKAFVQSNADFSLLQMAVIKNNVQSNPGADKRQTVEAGWINYPAQVQQPHLFTFYTTNGYFQAGDNVGGWNTDVKGWVQTDATIHPGTVFSPLSVDGGAQYDIKLQYTLYQDNWWLFVRDRYIGYYPAQLFRANRPDQTLASGADQINFYGEIFDADGGATTSDMGSGEFSQTRFGHSAYIRNIKYQSNSGDVIYDGGAQIFISDPNRYNLEAHFNSGDPNWGSYFWVGGPGAGGVIGA
jgi:hypothetical protein